MTVIYRIPKWFGRLGNNLIQISNCLWSAYTTHGAFEMPEHDNIAQISERFCMPGQINPEVVSEATAAQTFHGPPLSGRTPKFFEFVRDAARSTLYQALEFPLKNQDPLPENTLVVHVRSTDIVRYRQSSKVNKTYMCNPITFFDDAAKQFDHVIVLSQSDQHPLLTYFQERDWEIRTGGTIEEDAALILRAQNLCIGSTSSFSAMLGLCSQHLKRIYLSSLSHQQWKCPIDSFFYHVSIEKHFYLYPMQWIETQKNTHGAAFLRMLVEFPVRKMSKLRFNRRQLVDASIPRLIEWQKFHKRTDKPDPPFPVSLDVEKPPEGESDAV